MFPTNRTPTIRQLQLFSALVETQSVSKTAERLFIAQPSVSIQLKKLSELLGVELYHQRGKQIVITEVGQTVYRAAQQIACSFENLAIELNAYNGLQAGTLRLCIVSTAQHFMPQILGPFCREFPNIDVELTIKNRKTVIERAMQNLDDFYVLSHCPDDLALIKMPFLHNDLVVIAPERHELTRKPSVSLNRIIHYPFILREKGSGTRTTIDNFCRQHNIALHQRMMVESNDAIKNMVAEGLGLAILSRHSVENNPTTGVVTLPVEHFPIVSDWYLVHSKQRKLSLLAQAFSDYIHQHHVKRR
ncbi:LysR family transcriptional regulator [Thalassotalea sp. LPB0316]|uniref:LysR family transcriptional regulator n=1 Tax=Thalassotalea sp. LPB0316 TaxID=2769490 RepID=UPI0018683B3E|nr:LysR family transcriptional regulator [Thalassotalea sp. LPB0316]QOL25362.1 LysR family transcriptional regulator [Thalassotalea sp. LPB0316]